MKNIKIGIIGAGSGAFALELIRDIGMTPNLAGSTVCFMDIDSKRLDAIHAICGRYVGGREMDLRLEKTTDRKRCLEGADFIINTALCAPHQRLREGWEVARRNGFDWGGSYHVMYDEAFWINYYQFKLFESITEDILSICPDAWHLLVANPVLAGVTHLGRRYPIAKVVGLCHGTSAIYRVAEILGLDRADITYEAAGVNHFVFITRFHYRGEDGFTILDRWIERESEAHWRENRSDQLNPKIVDLYKKFGVLAVGDTANWSGASWPWWYHSDPDVEAQWARKPDEGWNHYFQMVERKASEVQEYAADPSRDLGGLIGGTHSGEPMIPVIESIACGIPRVIITNVMNSTGLVPGVPTDFQVEIPTLVSARGVQGIQTTPLPRNVVAHILRDRVAPVEIELDAYNAGSRDQLVELVLTDHWCRSRKQAEQLIEGIFALPYHAEMRARYR